MSVNLMLTIFATFIGLVLLVLVAKKIYFKFICKKRYFVIPKVGTRGISNIGMILALSVAVVLLIILVTADIASLVFRLWPGTRIIIEGVLIKIGGLLFGPIIGLCLGAATDLLTIAYTGGIFHYGYLISAMLFGLFGGLIRILVKYTGRREFKFSIMSTILTVFIVAIAVIFISFTNTDTILYISLFGLIIPMTIELLFGILVAIPVTLIMIMWFCYLIQFFQLKKNPDAKKWYMDFAIVFTTIIITEIIINVIMMPSFDAVLSPLNYQTWFIIRLLLLVPMVAINIIIILPVYKIINPILNYDYEDELVEDLKRPLVLE